MAPEYLLGASACIDTIDTNRHRAPCQLALISSRLSFAKPEPCLLSLVILSAKSSWWDVALPIAAWDGTIVAQTSRCGCVVFRVRTRRMDTLITVHALSFIHLSLKVPCGTNAQGKVSFGQALLHCRTLVSRCW
jgi:hypothetical protein